MLVVLLAEAAAWPLEQPAFPAACSTGAVSPTRTVHLLTGDWDFSFLNATDYNVSTTTSLEGISFDRKQAVPAAWDAAWGTGLQYTRGVGAYRASVPVTPSRDLALHFAACSMFCRVYVSRSRPSRVGPAWPPRGPPRGRLVWPPCHRHATAVPPPCHRHATAVTPP